MAMGRWYRRWRRRRWLQHHPPDPRCWQTVRTRLPLLGFLDEQEQARLAALSALFIHEKQWFLQEGLELGDGERLGIAAQACLPILKLDLDWYRGWHSLVIYPDSFLVSQDYADEAGVVHHHQEARAGEVWPTGPMVLSWADIQARWDSAGFNVIIHECSHRLDMLNGEANGRPPLHPEMSPQRWARVLGEHYQALSRAVERGEETFLDPYGTEHPAEFFAVASETFFTLPAGLRDHHPALYAELSAFYRQDPAGSA